MRKKKVVEETLKFTTTPERDQIEGYEIGQMTVYFKLQIEELEDKIYEDVREIEKIYYDPFQNDEAEILRSLDKVEKVLAVK